jgi:hypothetical protein
MAENFYVGDFSPAVVGWAVAGRFGGLGVGKLDSIAR